MPMLTFLLLTQVMSGWVLSPSNRVHPATTLNRLTQLVGLVGLSQSLGQLLDTTFGRKSAPLLGSEKRVPTVGKV